ncbi:MAG: hypothetical protein AABX99_00095, partial [Nanoarchaeota archaeon]
KRGGIIEKLLELHNEYLSIYIEEQDRLAFILFYSLKDALDKIYDPRKESLDDARTINLEYLPQVKKTIYNSFVLLITSSSDKKYIENILEGVIDFYKNSRVFDDYKENIPYLLEKIFYSLCCFCLENNYSQIIKTIIKHSLPLPKEYILVGEKGLLPLKAKEIIELFSSGDFSSMDKENIQIFLFLILISKFYGLHNKKGLKNIFEELSVNNETLKIILMHKFNFEILIKRSELYNKIAENILWRDDFIKINLLSKEFLKFIDSSEGKILEKDKEKELDIEKVKSFTQCLIKSFEENKSIDDFVSVELIGEINEFSPLNSKIKLDKIWFVNVSGTTAYASDPIGGDFGRDLAGYELKMLTQKLNGEVKHINNFKNNDDFIKDIEKLNQDNLVLLCPFEFTSKIRELVKYDYSNSPYQIFIEIGGKKIQIYYYFDVNKMRRAFVFIRKNIKWERKKFDFDAIKGVQEDKLKFKNQPLSSQFITQEYADAKDKEQISKTEVIVSISYGFKAQMKNLNKVLCFKY